MISKPGMGVDLQNVAVVSYQAPSSDLACGLFDTVNITRWERFRFDDLKGEIRDVHEVREACNLRHGVQRFQQSRHKTSRGTQPRTRGNVRHAGNLKLPNSHVHQPEGFADYGVTNVSDGGNLLQMRVLNQESINESRVNIDVDVLVDRACNQKTSVLAKVRG